MAHFPNKGRNVISNAIWCDLVARTVHSTFQSWLSKAVSGAALQHIEAGYKPAVVVVVAAAVAMATTLSACDVRKILATRHARVQTLKGSNPRKLYDSNTWLDLPGG